MSGISIAKLIASGDEEFSKKILLIALWKSAGNKVLEVTEQDIQNFNMQPEQQILFLHGHKHSIEVGVVPLSEAQRRAEKSKDTAFVSKNIAPPERKH